MRLEVKDFGRIKEANINLGEITVIAGKNDTGKSTISKILYSLINGLSEEGREKFKKYYIQNQIDEITFELYKKTSNIKFRDINRRTNYEDVIEEILDIAGGDTKNCLEKEKKLLINLKKMDIKDEGLKKHTVVSYFASEFGEKFIGNSVKNALKTNQLKLLEKHSELKYFESDEKDMKVNKMTPFRNVIYLETPFLYENDLIFHHTQMVNNLIKEENLGFISSETQRDLMEEINKIIGGNYIVENSKIYLERDGMKISNENIATGIKSLGQIKLLLEKGILKKDSFLILDEPEVHLHPEWQIKLAQIIGLLNRKLEIKILINTHSSYFVEAIDVFKDYYKIKDVNYYLAELGEAGSKFREVTNDISQIYSSLSQQAYDMLDEFKSKTYFEEQGDVK